MLVYPFDTIKTRRQSQDYLKTYSRGGKNNAFALRGLYQGIGSVVLVTLPAGKFDTIAADYVANNRSRCLLLYVRAVQDDTRESYIDTTAHSALVGIHDSRGRFVFRPHTRGAG